MDDWLEAERDLACTAESDLTEKDSGFQLQVAVPGFDEKEALHWHEKIRVLSTPG